MDRVRCRTTAAPAAAACGDAPQRLLELLQKYDLLVELRLSPAGRTQVRRDAMRRIAARFPGALREWDSLPLGELQRRRAVVARAVDEARHGQPAQADRAEPWLRYTLDLHAHLGRILELRRFARSRRQQGWAADAILAAWHVQQGAAAAAGDPGGPGELGDPGGPLTVARLERICAPEGGRLTAVVFADLAERHGVQVGDIKRAIYEGAGPVGSAGPSGPAGPAGGPGRSAAREYDLDG